MNKKITLFAVFALMSMVIMAGCTKSNTYSASNQPALSTENTETTSTASGDAAGSFVEDSSVTSDQTLPDLS